MQYHAEQWLLVSRVRHDELQSAARRHRLASEAKRGRSIRVRNHQLRSGTASVLEAAARLIAPSAA